MAKLYINENNRLSHINPEIYGQFSEHLGRCIYEGIFVKEDSPIPNVNGMRKDVVDALREIRVPVLRWPGGCFADEYHWKDGTGPKETRKKMVNTNWGGVVEDNSFGTHEYFELCRQLGCKTYITGNLGSGTVQEMNEWVEYMTFDGTSPLANERAKNGHPDPWKVDYFGVGNENWGCGGNMTPEYYGNEYRRYQRFIKNYKEDEHINRIACGPNGGNYDWTSGLLSTCFADPDGYKRHGFMEGLSLHYYTKVNDDEDMKSSATKFSEEEYYRTLSHALRIEELIEKHSAIMDQYDPEKNIGMMVDEWGTWYDVEPGTNPGFLYQQNTMRDALVAALSLNIFNKHSDRVKMTCIAQMVNVLQAMILTEGTRMLRTPTYHVYHMYRDHQDADLLESSLSDVSETGSNESKMDALQESVSVDAGGTITVTVANLSLEDSYPVEIQFNEKEPSSVTGSILHDEMDAFNTFNDPDRVIEQPFEDAEIKGKNILFTIPACSVVSLRIG